MFNFDSMHFFDNHTHRIDVSNREITPLDLGVAFMHGWGPIYPVDKPLGISAEAENCTPEYAETVMNMGVVKVVVNLLAQKFGCEATPEAVVAERNKRTAVDGYGWAKELYADANVIGEMADDGAPYGDPALKCFPTTLYRLFQMDPFFRSLLKECGSYDELKDRFDSTVRARLAEGFDGVKSHLFELRLQPIRVIEDAEAAEKFAAAKVGDKSAFEDVYLAIFAHVLKMTQELNFSVHVHTGCTGNPNDLQTCTDPFAICPLMRDHRFFRSHIVFLHGNYPDIRHAALITHSYPNVWVDLGWTLPWVSLNMEQILEETLAIAPHNKVMLGTGQHNHPEMCWAAAKVAKKALAHVMQKWVDRGMIAENQAVEIAENVLYKNALRLYGTKE